MELKIGKKNYEINLGIAALKYLDDVYVFEDEASGFKFGLGVEMLTTNLAIGNTLALVHFIKAGTITERSKPSDKDIEEFFGSLSAEEFEKFVEDVKDELKKQPLTRMKANQVIKNMETQSK